MNQPGTGLPVLVVEDNNSERWLYSEILRTRGHVVTACADGDQGWDAWSSGTYPLVLLDLRLPGGSDGLQLCRRIRASEDGSRSIILVVTGRDEPETLEAVLEAGADDYIRKPIDVGLLNVRLAIAEREAAREASRFATSVALERTASELSTLFSNLDDVFFSIDWDDDRLIQISPAVQGVIGHSQGEILMSYDLYQRFIMPPEARSRLEAHALSEPGQRMVHPFAIRTPDGAERWVQASYKPVISGGTISRVDGVLTDITERQRSQVELAARNREIATLARITEITLSADTPGGALHQSLEEISRATGYPIVALEEWIEARDVMRISHALGFDVSPEAPLEIPVHETLSGQAVKERRPVVETELRSNRRHRAKAFEDLGLRAWLSFPLVSGGRATGCLTLAHTEPVQPEPRLVRMGLALASTLSTHLERMAAASALRDRERGYRSLAQQLQRANEELESFAYSVSHDLRVPLRTMQGFAHALLQNHGDRLPEDARDFARRIIASGEKAELLIADLLEYSRLSVQNLEFQRVDLREVLDDALDRLQAVIGESRASIDTVGEFPVVRAHHLVLVQVLVNLVGNAIKFVPEGRRPEVRIEAIREADGTVRIEVEDNGIGIPADKRDRIFRVFERLVDQTDREGTGIGLAIVRRGMERLGGRVGVRDGSVGSVFWVTIPGPPGTGP